MVKITGAPGPTTTSVPSVDTPVTRAPPRDRRRLAPRNLLHGHAPRGGREAASAAEKEWGTDAEKAIIAALEHASRSERLAHHAKAGFSKAPNSFGD